jgi:hypothetical protein
MTKNTAKIKAGITLLAHKPYEILSGTVVSGSVDTEANTISVQTGIDSMPIQSVMLTAVAGENSGLIIVPKEGSHVIIGSIDGPGHWVLLRASELTNVILRIGAVRLQVDDNGIKIESGNAVLDIGSLIKINTSGESLFTLLNDLITAVSLLTVGTHSGPSTPPVNVASFSALIPRLNNLLSA